MKKKVDIVGLITKLADSLSKGTTMENASICACSKSFNELGISAFTIMEKMIGKQEAWKVIRLAAKIHNAAFVDKRRVEISDNPCESNVPCVKMPILLLAISILYDRLFLEV